MGLKPKSVVEAEKRIKRQAKIDKKRKVNTRTPQLTYLIICEGERTEPEYFKSLIAHNNKNTDILLVDIEGEGRGTVSLINKAIAKKNRSIKEYDKVWAVFDKDDFEDFNDAIRLANKNDINCAWSNESFELWYYLHFQFLDTGISRSDYIDRIEREIRTKTDDKSFKYAKKAKENYTLVTTLGSEKLAIKYAEALCKKYDDENYCNHLPCTKIHLLVNELRNPQKVLEELAK